MQSVPKTRQEFVCRPATGNLGVSEPEGCLELEEGCAWPTTSIRANRTNRRRLVKLRMLRGRERMRRRVDASQVDASHWVEFATRHLQAISTPGCHQTVRQGNFKAKISMISSGILQGFVKSSTLSHAKGIWGSGWESKTAVQACW